jgi:hypothetical protein
MGILTLLQHKEAAVAEPPAKNTSIFVAESTEGAGEEEVLAERPAIKVTTKFFRFIMGDSRRILGTANPAAEKEETEAASETGFEASASKLALVTVALKAAEAVKTVWTVEVGAVAVLKFSLTTAVGSVYPLGTFLLQPGQKIKLKKTEGKATFTFTKQEMN